MGDKTVGVAILVLMAIAVLMVCIPEAIAAIFEPSTSVTVNCLTPIAGIGLTLALVTAMFGVPYSILTAIDQMGGGDDV